MSKKRKLNTVTTVSEKHVDIDDGFDDDQFMCISSKSDFDTSARNNITSPRIQPSSKWYGLAMNVKNPWKNDRLCISSSPTVEKLNSLTVSNKQANIYSIVPLICMIEKSHRIELSFNEDTSVLVIKIYSANNLLRQTILLCPSTLKTS